MHVPDQLEFTVIYCPLCSKVAVWQEMSSEEYDASWQAEAQEGDTAGWQAEDS